VNWIHRRICRSAKWTASVETTLLPWALADLELGPELLEIGPGFGVTTAVLARRDARLTALELDPKLVDHLNGRFGDSITVVHGDGTRMPLPDNEFSAALCFTMLHHVPSPALQDRVFAEAFRVLRPGGVFAGIDTLPSLRFRLIHLADTLVIVDPEELPSRLRAAGFEGVEVTKGAKRFRFRARRP
jgi:SAM-dependent methyltransferase